MRYWVFTPSGQPFITLWVLPHAMVRILMKFSQASVFGGLKKGCLAASNFPVFCILPGFLYFKNTVGPCWWKEDPQHGASTPPQTSLQQYFIRYDFRLLTYHFEILFKSSIPVLNDHKNLLPQLTSKHFRKLRHVFNSCFWVMASFVSPFHVTSLKSSS